MSQVSFHRAEKAFRIEIPCKNSLLKSAEDGLAIKCQCHSFTPCGKVEVPKVEVWKQSFFFLPAVDPGSDNSKDSFSLLFSKNKKNNFSLPFFFFLQRFVKISCCSFISMKSSLFGKCAVYTIFSPRWNPDELAYCKGKKYRYGFLCWCFITCVGWCWL